MAKTALVIVHLSSLDSYTEAAREEAGDESLGMLLADAIADEVLQHQGPVYIIDQGWSLGRRESRPRESLMLKIADRKDIVWIKFDEDTDDWDEFLADLVALLKKDRVKRVVIGGIWYDPELHEGCATEVYLHLRRHFYTNVNYRIVGCEGDFKSDLSPRKRWRPETRPQ
jgi:hypothetical protein